VLFFIVTITETLEFCILFVFAPSTSLFRENKKFSQK
jgi:hypothetical protein